MSDGASYQAALGRFNDILYQYEAALEANDAASAQRRFAECRDAWEELRQLQTELEVDDFLVYAFSSAVGAKSVDESKRVYDLMNDQQRINVDLAEESKPGLVKIWLRR